MEYSQGELESQGYRAGVTLSKVTYRRTVLGNQTGAVAGFTADHNESRVHTQRSFHGAAGHSLGNSHGVQELASAGSDVVVDGVIVQNGLSFAAHFAHDLNRIQRETAVGLQR